jgi:hypothetical protein
MTRASPRIPRTVPKGKRKPNLRRAAQHLAFVRSLGICLACGARGPVEAMHVRGGTDGGTGMKPSDKFSVPGDHACHMRQHQIGEVAFWGQLGIDPLNVSLRLWTVSGDVTAGIRIIERARQAIELRSRSPSI